MQLSNKFHSFGKHIVGQVVDDNNDSVFKMADDDNGDILYIEALDNHAWHIDQHNTYHINAGDVVAVNAKRTARSGKFVIVSFEDVLAYQSK